MARRRRYGDLAALGGVAAAAELAVLLLRPRTGIIRPVPIDPDAYFAPADVRRARAFRRPQLALLAARTAMETAALAALARRPAPHRRPGRAGRLAAAGEGAALSLGLELIGLPLSAAARRRAIAVGLVTDSWRSWAVDRGKAATIGAGLTAGGAAAVAALQGRFGARWWLPASGLAVGFGVAAAYAGPVLLDPRFNRFTPLPQGPLRADILALAERAGVRVGEVYEVDASRRTTAANAYVTGLGPTKRVVLFDTLLEHFDPAETRLVVAHELAHMRHRDVPRSLALLALTAPPMAAAVARLGERLGGAQRLNLPALALAAGIVGVPVGVIANQLSRRVEARADSFALRITGDPQACISFERRIALRNLADPDPPAWVRTLLGTHPPIVERIGIAEAFARGAPAAA